ncbi:MAG: cytochrome c oxidase subunit 3 family protein [Desulfobacteraceae bacterium]|nr:MAG: cytochrome c oxidase subunit 3 family protein [Desulfobacteraceae bacterium]
MKASVDETGKKMGMWLFLYTEIILFGGLFVLYAVYFSRFTADFIQGGKQLSLFFGAFNTVILLLSSFTVAASITAVQKGQKKAAVMNLLVSILCGVVFLINKYVEWGEKIHHGIYPNSDTLTGMSSGQNIFFGLYYVITGLHGLHIIIGLILLLVALFAVSSGRVTASRFMLLENSGLYWHLVDLIWIFIFPLFYLVI